jgi:predicted nucleic acid-binding protein
MTLYVDSSALLKRYVDAPDSAAADELLGSNPVVATGRHTVVEVRRNLARLLEQPELGTARSAFATDLSSVARINRARRLTRASTPEAQAIARLPATAIDCAMDCDRARVLPAGRLSAPRLTGRSMTGTRRSMGGLWRSSSRARSSLTFAARLPTLQAREASARDRRSRIYSVRSGARENAAHRGRALSGDPA